MRLVGGEVVPEMLEVRSLTPGDERLGRRSVESKVPNRRIVVDRLPPFDSRQERVHQHELVDVFGGNWAAYAYATINPMSCPTTAAFVTPRPLTSARIRLAAWAMSRPSLGMPESPMPGRSGAMTVKRVGERSHQGAPHAGRLGVAVQQDHGGTMARHQVMQLHTVHCCDPAGDRQARAARLLRDACDDPRRLDEAEQKKRDTPEDPPVHHTRSFCDRPVRDAASITRVAGARRSRL